MITVVVEVDAIGYVSDLQPRLVSRLQMLSGFESKRTVLIAGFICYPTPTVKVAVQIKADSESKFVGR